MNRLYLALILVLSGSQWWAAQAAEAENLPLLSKGDGGKSYESLVNSIVSRGWSEYALAGTSLFATNNPPNLLATRPLRLPKALLLENLDRSDWHNLAAVEYVLSNLYDQEYDEYIYEDLEVKGDRLKRFLGRKPLEKPKLVLGSGQALIQPVGDVFSKQLLGPNGYAEYAEKMLDAARAGNQLALGKYKQDFRKNYSDDVINLAIIEALLPVYTHPTVSPRGVLAGWTEQPVTYQALIYENLSQKVQGLRALIADEDDSDPFAGLL